MTNSFDRVINRRHTCSLKWDFMQQKLGVDGSNKLPMWVSDYDFQAPEAVLDIMQQRINHGIFGYAERDNDYYQAIINWYQSRHQLTIDQDWITTVHGVLPGLSVAIQMLTNIGDNVVIQTPGYGSFRKITELNDRVIIENPLIETNGHYCMDLTHLEHCFQQGAKVMIFATHTTLLDEHGQQARLLH